MESRRSAALCRYWASCALLLLLPPAVLAQATVSSPNQELIVLLPATSNPVAVAAVINAGGFAPYGLNQGDPVSARLLSEERPTGRMADWVALNPDRPLSRFYRYMVVRYPESTDTEAVRGSLAASGQLQSIEPNVLFTLHGVTPSDPFFGSFSSPDPNFGQWGLHLLNIPQAWEWGKGYVQIGVIDTGVLRSHPELQAYTYSSQTQQYTYVGGNVHEHLSYDWLNQRCDIDERDSPTDPRAGHGSHVTGILAAKTNNALGVAGVCWNCGIQMQKTFPPPANGELVQATLDRVADAGQQLLAQGVPLLNGSFGILSTVVPSCGPTSATLFCNMLAVAEERHALFVAAAGNDISTVDFPARDPRVLAVGGVKRVPLPPPLTGYGWALWDDRAVGCTGVYAGTTLCGSNIGPELDLVAPARDVVSSLYTTYTHNQHIRCSDAVPNPDPNNPDLGDTGIPGDGFGMCRGTSMAAPFVTGIAALVRSANPLLSKEDVVDVLKSTASQAASPGEPLGYGLPNAEAAVRRALGDREGKTLRNRLTPLFTVQSLVDQTYLSTSSPQEAAARTYDGVEPYDTVGPLVPWYDLPGSCSTSPCPQNRPGASLYVFTSDQPPYPGAPPLAPLYKLRWDPDLYLQCSGNNQDQPRTRYTYTTTADGISHFKNRLDPDYHLGFDIDGQLGFIYNWCEPDAACQPPGTVKVYRMYHPGSQAWALVSELELAAYSNAGYTLPPLYRAVVGYAYPNVDSDHDALIDGFETLAGTNPNVADTDCDGASDGEEVLLYDRSDPDPSRHGYGDPLVGPCGVFFFDDFELGNLSRWSLVSSGTSPD